MYAIVEAAGAQFRMEKDQVLEIPALAADAPSIVFDRVLLVSDGAKQLVGRPYVEGGRVTAEVIGELLTDKVRIVKYKRRTKYRRTRGHRQPALQIRVTGIEPSL